MSEHDPQPFPAVDLSKPPAENMVRVTFMPENKTVEFPFDSLPYEGHGDPMSFLDVAKTTVSSSTTPAAESAPAPPATSG